jgi:ABC-type uncharacterized transport system substrate-binding protein
MAYKTILAILTFSFAWLSAAEAQQRQKMPRIGFIAANSASTSPARFDALKRGLRELGYIEGKNIIIEWRFADGKLDRLPAIAAELVRLKVDVIVTAGGTPTGPAKAATTSIPIVMAQDNDPVGDRFVTSLARPEGNITGLSNYAPEIGGKRLDLLNETVPKLSRVTALGTSDNPSNDEALRHVQAVAKGFGIEVQYFDVGDSKQIEAAFRDTIKARADAVLGLGGPVLTSQRKQIASLAKTHRLPVILHTPEFVEAGGLMSYGVNIADLFYRAATYVDKILKGSKPADLPVEQPRRFELLINLATANEIGITIPPNVLARADRVIK